MGPAAHLPLPPHAPALDFPQAVLLPGLVNAHTHLELHRLRGQVRETDFFEWLQHVRKLKETTDAAGYERAAQDGLREAWRFGTTTVADSGTSGAAVRVMARLGGRGVYYHEVIAPEPGRRESALAAARAAVRRLIADTPGSVRVGVSPHAPYTVSAELAAAVARWAREAGLPLAAHVAESPAESDFLTRHQGPFAELWRRRRIPLPARARSPVAYLDHLGLLGDDLLAIHVVQADESDVAVLAARRVAVAACPRSNRRHGHGTPPLRALLDAGVRVGLGTDSVASVESLDLLAEASAARALAGLSAERALRLITTDGARALGLERDAGSLTPGAWGDCCVVRLAGPPPADAEVLAGRILHAGSGSIAATLVGGREVYAARPV